MNTFVNNQHKLTLKRWPVVNEDPLQAWDAADEYVLEYLAEIGFDGSAEIDSNVVILNDAHGALATALRIYEPQSWNDSYLSHRSALENLKYNGSEQHLRSVPSTDTPMGKIDLLIIRVPKTTALLQDQLCRIRAQLHDGTKVVAAGMVKHLQKSAFKCLEETIGPVTTSLAKKKARLIFPVFDDSLTVAHSPYPSIFEDADVANPISNHANVFSRERLDHGARFLLHQYSFLRDAERVVDLACGNGVLGLEYLKRFPESKVTFIDESYSAVDSAQSNYQAWFPSSKHSAEFLVADGLETMKSDFLDLILCNPPFHLQHTIGDQVALSMFTAAKRCLRQKGELWVVANQHLGYSGKLKRLFGNCRIVASNKKFAVFKVVKR